MAFKLAVEDKVCVTLKGKLPGAAKGSSKAFDFTITMARNTQDEIAEAMKSGESIVDFIVARASAWNGQRLVLNDDNTPADFSEDALRALLTIAGMPVACYQSYLRDVGVQEKN